MVDFYTKATLCSPHEVHLRFHFHFHFRTKTAFLTFVEGALITSVGKILYVCAYIGIEDFCPS